MAVDNALDAAGNAVENAGEAVENAGEAVENAADNALVSIAVAPFFGTSDMKGRPVIRAALFFARSKWYFDRDERRLPVLLLLLAACNREERPEAPTRGRESERLNDAEAMLNGLANEEGPATEAADPSNQFGLNRQDLA